MTDAGTATDGSQGPTLPAIRCLVDRWRGCYDWRAAEGLINGWAEKRIVDLRHYHQPSNGGHFVALENPAAFVADARATFATLK